MDLPEGKPRFKTVSDWLWQIFCGMCMGAADLVPGISGGTVAFIMGIYQGLINSLKTLNPLSFAPLLRLNFRKFFDNVAWEFLSSLILGASISFLLFAEAFDYILNHEDYRAYLYSGFMGLILGSAIFCAKQVNSWKIPQIVALLAGGLIAFMLTGSKVVEPELADDYGVYIPIEKVLNPREKELRNYTTGDQVLSGISEKTLSAMLAKGVISATTPVYSSEKETNGVVGDFIDDVYETSRINLTMVGCGAIAICAMLLPGISGSYLLTIMGAYPTVIGALADLSKSIKKFSFDTDAFFILFSLGIGIVIGAILFARVLSWLLKNYYDSTIAMLIGFMLGALRSVWPFWTYAYELLPLRLEKGPQIFVVDPTFPDIGSMLFWSSIACMVVGIATVFAVEALAKLKTQ